MVSWRTIFSGSLRQLYRFFEELFKEMGLYGTLVWMVLCGVRDGAFKNHSFNGSLRRYHRFFEELFKEMVQGAQRVKNPGLKGSLWNQKWFFYDITLKNHVLFQMDLHGSVCTSYCISTESSRVGVGADADSPGRFCEA